MKKAKLYFENEDAELCHPLEYHLNEAKADGLIEVQLLEAIPDKTTHDFIWCTSFGAVSERGNCGKVCPDYEPRNKKSGICKHQGRMFTHGNAVKFEVATGNIIS